MYFCVSDAALQDSRAGDGPLQTVLAAAGAVPVPDPLGRLACWRLEEVLPEDRRKLKAWGRHERISLAFLDCLPKWSDFSVLMTDMDHTLIDADVLQRLAGLADKARAYRTVMTALEEGKINFEASLKQRAALLAGLPESVIGQVVSGLTFTEGIVVLISEARRNGLRSYILTSGIDDIAQPLSEMLCMTGTIANHLGIREGVLTADIKGPLGGPCLDAQGKCRQMMRIAGALSLKGSAGALCCGDSGNDALMLAQAGLGVSFYGTPAAVEAAGVNINTGGFEWVLDLFELHGRLPGQQERG